MLDAAQETSEREKIRALPWNLAHSALTSVFFLWTFGGSVFILFLSELGLPKGQIGTLLSFFPFCGLVALGFAPLAARIGRKRVFLAGYGIRYFVMATLLFLPWIIARAGHAAGVAFLFIIILIFAMLRALAETAYYPWTQEFIPNSVRGRFAAVNNALSTFASGAALVIAGIVIGAGHDLSRYLWLLGIGLVIGLVGIVMMVWVPGGQPQLSVDAPGAHFTNMTGALHDPNLVAYLKGMGGVMVGTVLLTSFLPLYLKEQLGLPAGTVVALDTAVMIGGALSSLIWGWAADRVGSRPVLMVALTLSLVIPINWLILPRSIPNAVVWCAVLYFAYGVVSNGTAIGAGRLLFNGVVPPQKNTAYTAIYYAWLGLTGGVAPLLAGAILTALTGWQTRLGPLVLDGHAALFFLSFVLLSFGWQQYSRVKPDGIYTTRTAVRQVLTRFLVRRG